MTHMAETRADVTADVEDLAVALCWEVQELAAEFARTPEGRGIRRPCARHAWISQHLADERRRATVIAVLHRRRVRSGSLRYVDLTWPAMPKDVRQRVADRALAMLDADTVVSGAGPSSRRPWTSQPPVPWDGGISGVALLLPPLSALAGALHLIFGL